MSLCIQDSYSDTERVAEVARAVFPNGNIYRILFDTFLCCACDEMWGKHREYLPFCLTSGRIYSRVPGGLNRKTPHRDVFQLYTTDNGGTHFRLQDLLSKGDWEPKENPINNRKYDNYL